ncbi:MAG TPA: bifunctional ADP-heptose synthase [Bacteroidia bacterium]|jgi:rfaE bifunctional protein kinase chain/domain|nr:bifunctional ADP-heptose synthase [Bacteroidia bacterium]
MKKYSVRKEHIRELFKSFNNLTALVIGDVMVDSYMWGVVSRISPEAPVPIVTVKNKEKRLGGAANVALNLQALGATPILCSVIGVDSDGQAFLDLLRQQRLSQKGILKSRERNTTVKTRVIGNNHQMIRVDEETEEDIATYETDQLLHLITFILEHDKIDVIIFEDYNKGLITLRLIQKVVESARKRGIPVAVDPKKKNFLNYKGVTLFKPNLKELKEGLKLDIDTDDENELQKIISSFRNKQKIDTLMLTLSEKGICTNSRSVKEILPAHIRTIADVSGAGDTVISVAALCTALETNPVLTASLANLAGGLVCEQVGVIPIDKEHLLKEALYLDFVK